MKNPVKNPVRPQRDALGRLRGGNPGNSGGKPGRSGRPKDQVRAACRAAFDERLPRLAQLADDSDAVTALKALDMLARYGGMAYSESDVSVQEPSPSPTVFYMPDNGRNPVPIAERYWPIP